MRDSCDKMRNVLLVAALLLAAVQDPSAKDHYAARTLLARRRDPILVSHVTCANV